MSSSEWADFIACRPEAHLLQTPAWAELKSRFGWSAARITVKQAGRVLAGAQVLFRPLPLFLGTVAYIPKGPIVDWGNRPLVEYLFQMLDRACISNGAVFLKVEPDLPQLPTSNFQPQTSNFKFQIPNSQPSPHTIQPRRTIVVDISDSEEAILARMKQKCRYNIGLARKKGVTVRAAGLPADLDTFNALMRVTGARDRFGVHAPEYYRAAYGLFQPAGQCELLLAEHDGQPLAGLMAFAHGKRAWYLYGASSDEGRNRMPNYLLQWEAMCWAKARGCAEYDLWGVPDEDEAALEAQFETRGDDLWGVYRFKRGFGGRVVRSVGAWDRVYNPCLYRLYEHYRQRRGVNLGQP